MKTPGGNGSTIPNTFDDPFKVPLGRLTEAYFRKGNNVLMRDRISFWRREFIKVSDPTEYRFGIHMCGSWEDYEFTKNNSRFLRGILDLWKDELELKMRSDALGYILDDIKSDTKTSITSAKYIEDKLSKINKKDNSKKELDRKKKKDDQVWSQVDTIVAEEGLLE